MSEENAAWESAVGKVWQFHGVDNCVFCLSDEDGDKIGVEAVEDENDGYRSMLETLRVAIPLEGKVFFDSPIASVMIAEDSEGEFVGYKLVDATDGHVWLRFGTDHADDYYPCFIFDYQPKKGGT